MTDQQKKKMALETFDMLCRQLPPNTVDHPASDPDNFIKSNRRRFHMRILPVERKPTCFWFTNACYYEILVGSSKTILGESLGSVQFFRYAKRKKYARREFLVEVLDILKIAELGARKGFNLKHGKKFHFEKHYYGKKFQCKIAANDLAWLIKKTLPLFQAL